MDGDVRTYEEKLVDEAKRILSELVRNFPKKINEAIEIEEDMGDWNQTLTFGYPEAVEYLEKQGVLVVLGKFERSSMHVVDTTVSIPAKFKIGVDWDEAKRLYGKWYSNDFLVCGCGDVSLDMMTGEAEILSVRHNLSFKSQRYKFLKLLLGAKGKLVGHDVIAREVMGNDEKKAGVYVSAIHELVKDIRRHFSIPKGKVIRGRKGYAIVCR